MGISDWRAGDHVVCGVGTPMTRRELLSGALAAAALAKGSGQTAEPPRVRDSFDFDWRFIRGDVPRAQEPNFVDASWRSLNLPHDWSIEGPFSMDEPSGGSGGHAPTGIGWYRKKFRLPAWHRDRRVSIEFDGIYQNGEVWINGQYLGKRPYGYISFAYDITPHLNAGGDNVIAVRVDNSVQPNSRWYTGSGIYRHTWLTGVNPVHVDHWGTFIITPRVSRDAATVHVRTRVLNDSTASAMCSLISEVVDAEGRAVAASTASQEIAPAGRYEFEQQVNVDKPRLWSVSTPVLYKVRNTVRVGDRIVDEYDTPFGIREAIFDADRGFLLNGEHVKLNGVCVHHDGGSVGAAVPERVWER
jgi:beta-galactosidase